MASSHSAERSESGPRILGPVTVFLNFLTAIYAFALSTTTGPLAKMVPLDESNSLVILIILSQISGILLTEFCNSIFEMIGWSAVVSRGIALPSFLASSPSTSFEGLFGLLGWKTTGHRRPEWHHLWILQRFILRL